MSFTFPSPVGHKHPTKLFAKIYNVFFCSKKTEQTSAVAQNASSGEKETQLDLVTVDGWKQTQKEWFEALKTGNITKVKDILAKDDIIINQTDESGWSALHLAAWNGYIEVLQVLLDHRCDVNEAGPGGSMALTLAAQKGHTHVVKLLLESQCEINNKAVLGNNMDVTALHLAAQYGHLEVVQLLVDTGATVNATMSSGGVKGLTPLHLAVEAGHLEVMDILIAAGCDVHSSTQPNSETPC